jgi:mannose-1-phosphate guanylyltransferase
VYESCLPEAMSVIKQIEQTWIEKGLDSDISALYAKMPRIPVDIGIMEKAEKRVVIPVHYDWSDVGSWRALSEISPVDDLGNTLPPAHLEIRSKNNYVHSGKFVALIGVENLVVVETENAILISRKEDTEDVKQIVEELKRQGKSELL